MGYSSIDADASSLEVGCDAGVDSALGGAGLLSAGVDAFFSFGGLSALDPADCPPAFFFVGETTIVIRRPSAIGGRSTFTASAKSVTIE